MTFLTLESTLIMILLVTMVLILIHFVYIVRKDSKTLKEALDKYDKESVESGGRKKLWTITKRELFTETSASAS